MLILVLNSGSSSLKFQIFSWPQKEPLMRGLIDRIGEASSQVVYQGTKIAKAQQSQTIKNHREAFNTLANLLSTHRFEAPQVIGHRVVHGGEYFSAPTRLTSEAIEKIRSLCPLAPLHNPANLLGIEACLERWPDRPQVAVFDTAFHHTLPEVAFRYAIPEALYRDYHIRRYGFHGTSHAFVAREAARFLQRDLSDCNVITLHLGNGSSACAVKNGKSIDISLGFTPLEGLVMGTRCGDIDPAIPFFLARETGTAWGDVEKLLNSQSGLKGLAGVSDMRDVEARADQGDARARLALEVFCYRIRKYIGAYAATLGQVDAIVFTAGIGENSASIRRRVCTDLQILGINFDEDANRREAQDTRRLSLPESRVAVLVVPTNEEYAIAEACSAFS